MVLNQHWNLLSNLQKTKRVLTRFQSGSLNHLKLVYASTKPQGRKREQTHSNRECSCGLIHCSIHLHSRRRVRSRWAMAFWSTSCVYRPLTPAPVQQSSGPGLKEDNAEDTNIQSPSHRHVPLPSTYNAAAAFRTITCTYPGAARVSRG